MIVLERIRRIAAVRAGLLATAALVALFAAAALAPAGSGAPPEDLELILSLPDDSDNVVPPDSTLRVSASLRHSGLEENLAVTTGLLYVTGEFEWDAVGRSRLSIGEQKVGAAAWRGSGAAFGDRFGAFGGAILDDDTFFIKALGNEFANGIWSTTDGKFYVYDVPTRTEAAIIEPPAGAQTRSWGEGFAAYQEDGDTGWIFVGSWRDTVTIANGDCGSRSNNRWRNGSETCEEVGRLYIYKYDRSAAEPADWTVELAATITPSAADARYRENSTRFAKTSQFGWGVALSEDGETLVVGSPRMDVIGAMLVFTKPTSSGGWADLTYADGVKLSPTTVPAEQTLDSSAPNIARAYGGRGWSTGRDGSKFGQSLVISGDGSVIASGTFGKQYNDNNQWYGSGRDEWGEVTVFVRPAGGWATDTTPDARLYGAATPAYKHERVGQYLTVSRDGSTIAAAATGRPGSTPATPGHVYLWERPGGGWSGDDNSPDATFSATGGYLNDQFGHLGVDFNYAGDKLAVSNSKYRDTGDAATSSYYGRAWVFEKPSSGWADATTTSATARQVESPEPRPGAWYGIISFVDDQTGRVVVTQHEDSSTLNPNVGPGAVWLLEPDPDRKGAWQPVFFAGSTCEIDGGQAVLDSTDDTNTCPLDLSAGTEIVIPPGTATDKLTISGQVTIDGQVYRGALEVRIGTVKEAAKATLAIGMDTRGTAGTGDDRPHKSSLGPGETTVLRLRVLNENDAPSASNSISSILITTSGGRLSTNVSDQEGALTVADGRLNQDGCIGTGGLACQIRVAGLNGVGSDQIDVTLRAPRPASPGQATVRATVLSTTGETLQTETVTIRFAGLPAVYAIAAPTTSVLNTGTEDEGAEPDNRDLLRLAVTASDMGGNMVNLPGTALQRLTQDRAIPSHRLTIVDPQGRRDPGGIMARWAANEAGTGLRLDPQGNALIEIDIDAAPEAALPSGEYTVEIRIDGQTATRMFTVSGGPALVSLSEPVGSRAISEQITLTARVTDTEGNAVPDGTPVRWQDNPTGTVPVLVQTSAETRTMNGLAQASYLVIGQGAGYVRTTAGQVSDIQLLTVGAATAAPGLETIAETLGATARPDDFAAWLGATGVQASELRRAVPGVTSVLLWQNGAWLRYGVVDGQEIPGSMDFTIEHGAVLWLGG